MNSSIVEPVRRPLAGYTIGITGHRRWEEQAEMLSRRGARVLHGPTMTTELLGDLDATIAATQQLLAEPVDLAILTTGIGVRSWFGAAASALDGWRAGVHRQAMLRAALFRVLSDRPCDVARYAALDLA